jgi:alpha-D-xyloside xylohydrolase
MKIIFFVMIILFPSLCDGQVIKDFKQLSDRIDITLPGGTLSICPLTENAVRIKFLKDADGRVPELIFTSGIRTPAFTISDSPSKLEVRLKYVVVALDKQDGKLSFEDSSGKMFLNEKAEHPEVNA